MFKDEQQLTMVTAAGFVLRALFYYSNIYRLPSVYFRKVG